MSGFLCIVREMDTYNVKNSLTKMKKREDKNQGFNCERPLGGNLLVAGS